MRVEAIGFSRGEEYKLPTAAYRGREFLVMRAALPSDAPIEKVAFFAQNRHILTVYGDGVRCEGEIGSIEKDAGCRAEINDKAGSAEYPSEGGPHFIAPREGEFKYFVAPCFTYRTVEVAFPLENAE